GDRAGVRAAGRRAGQRAAGDRAGRRAGRARRETARRGCPAATAEGQASAVDEDVLVVVAELSSARARLRWARALVFRGWEASAGARSTVCRMFPEHRPRRLRGTAAMRRLVRETEVRPRQLILPMFVAEGLSEPRPIASMPGVLHHTRESLRKAAVDAV